MVLFFAAFLFACTSSSDSGDTDGSGQCIEPTTAELDAFITELCDARASCDGSDVEACRTEQEGKSIDACKYTECVEAGGFSGCTDTDATEELAVCNEALYAPA